MAIARPSMRGFLSTPSGGGVVTPSDIFTGDDDDWWDASTDAHMTFVAARTVVSYETTGGNTTVTCSENPTGFSTTGSGDIVIIATGDPEIDGEWTITGATGATITFANPLGNTTIGPVSVSGTVQWKHRKISAWAGAMGHWTLTQATLAKMPQYNATTKRVLPSSSRSYYFDVPTGLRDALSLAEQSWWITSVFGTASNTEFLGEATNNRLRVFVSASGPTFATATNSSTRTTYTNASITNGNMKFTVSNFASGEIRQWLNDTATSVANASGSFLPNLAPGALYICRNGPSYSPGGSVFGSFGVKIDALLTEQNRIDLKAWGESQGDTYG